MMWSEFSPEEQCVVVCAIDEGDLRALLNSWSPAWTEDERREAILKLGPAVLAVAHKGFVEVYRSGSPSDAPPMTYAEVAEVVSNPTAWWNGEEGLDVVVWLVLTATGHELLSTISVDEMYAYRRRPEEAP